METIHVKENIPIGIDDQVVPLSKMMSQTPRQPLMDLKQRSRPQSVDVVEKLTSKSRVVTPVSTPQMKKSHRKLQPSSLVYQDNVDKENSSSRKKCEVDKMSRKPELAEIREEHLDDFVTKVIDTCVTDLVAESAAESKKSNAMDEISTDFATNTQATNNSATLELKDTVKCVTFKSTADNSIVLEHVENITENENTNISTTDPSVSMNEESLLADLSLSQYSECSDSFADSTKSEEELLASFAATPQVLQKSEQVESSTDSDDINTETFDERTGVPTPLPTFLEKVAFMQRVKKASSSMSSFVFPRQDMVRQLHCVPTGTVTLTHDVACSPMPATVDSKCLCKDRQSCSSVTCVDCAKMTTSEYSLLPNNDSEDSACLQVFEETQYSNDVSSFKNSPEDIVSTHTTSAACSPIPTLSIDTQIHDDVLSTQNVSVNTDLSTPCKSLSESKSTSCSPIPVPVCDIAIQIDKIETQSIMCSPIPVPMSDASIQNVAGTQSVMCSPMLVPVHNVSSQNDIIETQSTFCSPIRVPVNHASTQNEIETQSIMCSPMVPCPSHDKSVLVSGPECVDAGTSMDVCSMSDVGVDVKPATQTVGTDMQESPMSNCGTSMTPVKIGNKFGKKLTAEDVRKQHPRVLANELDTLRLQNTRLEAQVTVMDKDHKKLVAQEALVQQLDEMKARVTEQEQRYTLDMEAWQHKYDTLEAELNTATIQHEQKIINVRQEYEQTDYHDHFLSSQKLVRQLQTELNQYTELLSDIELSQKLQGELEKTLCDSYIKVKATGDSLITVKKHLEIQESSLSVEKSRYQQDVLQLVTDRQQVETERHNMATIVTQCKHDMTRLEEELQETTSELTVTKETMSSLQQQLNNTLTDLSGVTESNERLVVEVDEKTREIERLQDTMSDLQTDVTDKQAQIDVNNKQMSDMSDNLGKVKEQNEQLQLTIVNLERTLEMREADIDLLEKDLFECREIIYTQMESSKASETREKTTLAELHAITSESAQLKDCCAILRAKEQELRGCLASTQEELTGTKHHATRMLKQQGTEIADCSTAIGELTDHMTSVLANLNKRAGKHVKNSNLNVSSDTAATLLKQSASTNNLDTSSNNQLSQNSLVSQILNAAKLLEEGGVPVTKNSTEESQTDSQNLKSVNEKAPTHSQLEACKEAVMLDSPGTVSRKKLGFSGNSAFAPIKSGRPSLCIQNTNGQQIEKKSQENMDRIKKENNHNKGNKDCVMGMQDGEESSNKGEELSHEEAGLSTQLSRVSEVFVQIVHVAHLIEKALKSSLQDARSENDDLNVHVSQCEYTERRLVAELEIKEGEMTRTKSLCTQLQDKVESISDNFGRLVDQEAEVKRQEVEIRQLRGKVQSVEGEKDLLEEQIGELLHKIEVVGGHTEGTGSTTLDVRSHKELLQLQKKVEKYRNQLLQKEEQIDEISSKAARRIHKLEDNWKKADAEVCRFDELVDVIRDILISNQQVVDQNTELRRLVRLIDGQESVSAFNREKRACELKTHKTSKW